jgi:hypothetical protein
LRRDQPTDDLKINPRQTQSRKQYEGPRKRGEREEVCGREGNERCQKMLIVQATRAIASRGA